MPCFSVTRVRKTTRSLIVSRRFIPALVLLTFAPAASALADSATWKTDPVSGDWNTAANWIPNAVPNGASDIATFAASNMTNVGLSSGVEVNGIVFDAGASAFTITVGPSDIMAISGTGISNDSAEIQNWQISSTLDFENSATAGEDTSFLIKVNRSHSGSIDFFDTSTAGHGSFVIQATQDQIVGDGEVFFFGQSTAGAATFVINGGAANPSQGGLVAFSNNSDAGNATLTAKGGTVSGGLGARVRFENVSSAITSTLTATAGLNGGGGGRIQFTDHSRGGEARVEVLGNGSLDISEMNSNGVAIGSLEGDGIVILGSKNLRVGSNRLSTTFAGIIADGEGFSGGSLTKTGLDSLVLTNANTYTGGTTLKGSATNRGQATLEIDNASGSGTGSGPVTVLGGALRGIGTIAGPVTITDTNNGQFISTFLSPGRLGFAAPGTLTIQEALTINSGTFEVAINSATASKVVARGATLGNGASISFTHFPHVVPHGTVFTLIDNTADSLISGTFLNLRDGQTFTKFGITYAVSYEGGDGNDLTLTVQ
jgi:autotransporter-associated beta strand protein